jgi:prepilin-type processing-associated H-X9-DG protein
VTVTIHQRRRALTLLEVFTVLTIIVILIGLLLPAVIQTRDSARRLACKSNLMQIGLALRNYESAHDCLPPGSVDPNRPIRNDKKGYHFGWMVQILPHLDASQIYAGFDFSVSVYDKKNARAAGGTIEVFHCPLGGSFPSYAGCHHDVEAPIDVDNSGVLFLNSSIRRDDILDGAANTIFVGEAGSSAGWGWASGTRVTLRNTGTRINAGRVPPGGVAPIVALDARDPLAVGGFGSTHGAGANFAFGDGSVRYLNAVISPEVFGRLGNRADGELDPGDY